MKTYKITMSDGRRWDRIAHSAADAIQRALEANAGHSVLECWIGDRFLDSDKYPGCTIFEVPAHEPISKAEKRARSTDATSLLFDQAESARLGIK